MRVRAARTEDADPACHVLRRSITELCEEDHGNDQAFLARWLANKTPENVLDWITKGHVFVAEDDRGIIGIAALAGSGHITLNYVAPEARFRGVSKALLKAVERRALELGFTTCTLESTKTGRRFYQAAGYREQGGMPQSHMAKPLLSSGTWRS
jgi:GNAT superfamily N-acetyltransferase